MITPIRFLLRQSLPSFFCGMLQDLFIAAEIALLPKSRILFVLFGLWQWIGLLAANRFDIRLSLSHLALIQDAPRFFDSVKTTLPYLFLGLIFFLFCPLEMPPIFLCLGPIALGWCRKMDSAQELASSNPLFYLQFGWLIHPHKKQKQTHTSKFPALQTVTRRHRPPKKPNVLFLFLESFRAENVGTLGASIPASPCFDKLAERGILFTQCHATGPLTFYAALSSLFGIQPSLNTLHLAPYLPISLHGLPSALKREGYRLGWFDGGYLSFASLYPFLAKHGFDKVVGAEEIRQDHTSWGVLDELIFARAKEWLSAEEKPALAALFTMTNHHPWKPAPGWNFAAPPHLPEEYQRYLSTFSYTDQALSKFVETLDLENTLLFITGDHGQVVEKVARTTLRQENLHVPLLILGNGLTPQRINTPCSHIDLFTTAFELLQLEGPHHGLGRNLLDPGSAPLYFSLPAIPPRWGCRLSSFKWTGRPDGTDAELYDLEKDPEEKVNLAKTPKAEELKTLCLKRFQFVEQLFQTNGWAPKQQDVASANNLDLSHSMRMTDQELEALLTDNLRQLILPNSPFLTDRSFFAIADKCTKLTALTVSDHPLVTAEGLEAVLERCPLKLFSLPTAHGIETLRPKGEQFCLSALFLGETVVLTSENLAHWIARCPHLTHLEVNAQNWTEPELSILTSLQHLVHIRLFR